MSARNVTRLRGLPLLAAVSLGCASAPPCPEGARAPSEPAEPTKKPAGATPSEQGRKHAPHGHRGGDAEPRGPLVHDFDDPERWAKQFDDPTRKEWQKPADLVDAMGLEPGMTVADIGAGSGYFLPHLSPAVGEQGRVLAIDIEPNMVRYLVDRVEREQLDNVRPRLAVVDDPLLQPESVDRILIVNTWHHIPERPAYVNKLANALRPGGSLWVVDFELDSAQGPPRKHKLEPSSVVEDVKAGGLDTRLDRELLEEQYVVIGTKDPP